MARAPRQYAGLAVLAGLALGLCLGVMLLSRTNRRVSLGASDPGYIDWVKGMQSPSDPSFTDDLVPAAPVELPINYYYSNARCGRPCCDCYSDLSKWMDGAEQGEAGKSPEAEIAEHYSIPDENLRRYRKAFDSFSKKRGGKILTRDTDGHIKINDLQQLVKILGSNPSAKQLEYSIEQEELPKGGLDYPAFLTVMARHAPSWPVMISEAIRLPYSSDNVRASNDLRRKIIAAIAATAGVTSDQVELVRVRPIPGHQEECAIDFNVDAKSDDAETLKDSLAPARINEMLPRFGLQESTSPVAVYDKIILPLPISQVDDEVQHKVLNILADVTGVDVTQISLNKVVPDPEDNQQTKLVFFIEANTNEVEDIGAKLRKDKINEELVREGLPTTETLMHPKVQPHPDYMSFLGPGCARCANSPYMDGDNLGKDWIGNFPFDSPVSPQVSREVKRFDSHKPDCSCENDI